MNTSAPVDLILLSTFYEVVRAGTVTAAARELGRSQPAISHRLRLLEQDLGVKLFEKIGRRLVPTEQGRRLYVDCVDLMARSARLRESLLHSSEEAGEVLIGTLPTIASHLLVDPIRQLLADHPRLRLKFDFAYVEPTCEHLRRGTLDLAVIIGEHRDAGLEFECLGTTPLVAVLPPDSCLADVDVVHPSQLRSSGLRYLAYGGRPDATFDALGDFACKMDLIDDHTPHIPHIESLKVLCSRGAGYTLLPEYTTRTDRREGRLATALVEGLDDRPPISLVKRKTAIGTPRTQAVEKAIRTIGSML